MSLLASVQPFSHTAHIRGVVFSDYPRIAALTARNGLEMKNREEWEHMWANNPVYKRIPDWPMGWVAEVGQEIVGYCGNIPLSFSYKGQEIIGQAPHSLCLDPPHRGHMVLFAKRCLRYRKGVEYSVDSSANASSFKLLDALKVPRVPVGDWANSVFWIIDHAGFLASALERKRWPKFLAYPGAALLKGRDRLTKPSAWRRRANEVAPCETFDERFAAFWDELQQAYPNRFLSNRSREVLLWHFHFALKKKRIWIATLGDSSRITAYATFLRVDSPEIKLKRVRLVDFQVLDGNTEALIPLLAWALEACEKEGIHMLEAYGFRPDKQRVIDRIAPHRRQLPAWFYFYKVWNKEFAQEFRNPDIWDPSHYDGDATL